MTSTGHYLRSVTFTEKHRCFEAGDTFEFHPGVTLLVGDQGAGKSTLLTALRAHVTRKEKLPTKLDLAVEGLTVLGRDFEKENVRTQPGFGMSGISDFGFEVQAHFASHGEVVRMQLGTLDELDGTKPTLLLFDEPDGSLSLRSIGEFRDQLAALAAKGVQVIASVHHPWVIEGFPEVLSMEHRRWMASDAFILTQKFPRPKAKAPKATPGTPRTRRKSKTT